MRHRCNVTLPLEVSQDWQVRELANVQIDQGPDGIRRVFDNAWR